LDNIVMALQWEYPFSWAICHPNWRVFPFRLWYSTSPREWFCWLQRWHNIPSNRIL